MADMMTFPDTWEDDITKYTFYFTYENGHPCLKVKFHAINEERINGYLVCIEVKNVACGRTGRYKAINAFETRRNTSKTSHSKYYIYIHGRY